MTTQPRTTGIRRRRHLERPHSSLSTLTSKFPTILTLARAALIPPLAWAADSYRWEFAFALLALAALTDWLDGWLARRLNACTALGAQLDSIVDFALVFTLYGLLALRGVFPLWLPLLLLALFARFWLTRRAGRLVYDPLGKWLGAAAMAGLAALFVTGDELVAYGVLAALVALSAASLASRRLSPQPISDPWPVA